MLVPETGPVIFVIIHSSASDRLVIETESNAHTDKASYFEVLKFINLLNTGAFSGHFYICQHCDRVHFRYIRQIAVADLSDQIIKESMDIACFRLLYNVDPIHSIVIRGKTAEEALQELPLSTDPDADPDGGVE